MYLFQVGDFNWLAADKPSPHWSVMAVEERAADLQGLVKP
jgi:hypothetical protein